MGNHSVEDHSKQASDLISILASGDLRFISSDDLVTEMEHSRRELADLRMNGQTERSYHAYLTHRLGKITGELKRRRGLVRYGGPSVPRRGRIQPETLKEIKARIDLVALAAHYVHLEGGDRRVRFRCPVHGDGTDKDPSGLIDVASQRWHCFGCHSGGDAFDLLLAFEGISFREAVERLASMAGIELPQSKDATLGIYRHHEGGQHKARRPHKGWRGEVNL